MKRTFIAKKAIDKLQTVLDKLPISSGSGISVAAGMIDTGGTASGGASSGQKRKRCEFAEVVAREVASLPADDRAGDPRASLLGVVGSAVGTDSVGSVLYSAVDPATAGKVLACAPAMAVGLTPQGRGVPGTFAGELLRSGDIDGESAAKIRARGQFLEHLQAHSVPQKVGGVRTDQMAWPVNPTDESALRGTPEAVVKAMALHAADGSGACVPNPAIVAAYESSTLRRPAAAVEGASLDVYGGAANAERFATVDLPQAMEVVAECGKVVHNLPADSMTKIIEAAHNALTGQ